MFTILSISDSDKHFTGSLEEYIKRLGKELKIENLKPFKDDNHHLVIEKETKNLISVLEKKYPQEQKILLIKEGDKRDTLQFAEKVKGQSSVFIIGGPYGIDENLLLDAFPQMKRISFGSITLPHGLAKLTLVEQLYRITTLRSGKKYHY